MRYILNTNLALKRIILCLKAILWRIKNEALKTVQVSSAESIRLPDTRSMLEEIIVLLGSS